MYLLGALVKGREVRIRGEYELGVTAPPLTGCLDLVSQVPEAS